MNRVDLKNRERNLKKGMMTNAKEMPELGIKNESDNAAEVDKLGRDVLVMFCKLSGALKYCLKRKTKIISSF